jgi:ubiquinone/menaquinone biosynthesis C-methylase UbiE
LDNGADVIAIDINKNMVEVAKKRIKDKCMNLFILKAKIIRKNYLKHMSG